MSWISRLSGVLKPLSSKMCLLLYLYLSFSLPAEEYSIFPPEAISAVLQSLHSEYPPQS